MNLAASAIDLFVSNDEVVRLRQQAGGSLAFEQLPNLLALAWHLRQRDCAESRHWGAQARALLDMCTPPSAVQSGEPVPAEQAAWHAAAARLDLARAEIHLLFSERAEAEALLDAAESRFAAIDDRVGLGDCHWLWASVWVDKGGSAQVTAALQGAVDLYRDGGDTNRLRAAQARRLAHAAFVATVDTANALRELFAEATYNDPVQTWVCAARANVAGLTNDLSGSIRNDLQSFHAALNCGQVRQALVSAANAAESFSALGDPSSALEWSERALQLARRTGWPSSIGFCLMQLGDVMRHLGRLAEARGYLEEALQRMASQAGSRNHDVALGNLAQLLNDLGEFDAAHESFSRLERQVRACGEADLLVRAWRGQAAALFGLGHTDAARAKAQAALELAREQGGSEAQIQCLRTLAEGHRDEPAEALRYLTEALDLAAQIDGYGASPELFDQIAACAAACGDFAAAFAHKCAADGARQKAQWADAQRRAMALQVSQEVEKARADAEHHRALAASLQDTAKTLETLGAIGREITGSLDAAEICATLHRHVTGLLDATAFAVYLLSADGSALETAYGMEAGKVLPHRRIPLDHPTSLFARCARERDEVLRELEPGALTVNYIPGTLPTLSLLYAPLRIGDRLLGVISVQSPRPQVYRERERSIFRTLSAYGAIALDNAAAYAAAAEARRVADTALVELRRTQSQLLEDIAERRRVETELNALNNELEARIAERTRQISTALGNLAESRRKLQAIVDTALDAVIRADAEGRIIGWNAQAEQIFGWPADQVRGRHLHETIIPPAYRAAHRAGMNRYVASGVSKVIDSRIEIEALHYSGRVFPIELSITRVALDDSSQFEFCAFIRDITRRKQADEEIRMSLERQKELLQLKSRFISMASHEFRTPLASILSSVDLLRHYANRLPESERIELFDQISVAVQRMTKMLEDVLVIGRSDAERAEFHPVEMSLGEFCGRLVQEALADLQGAGSGARVAYVVRGGDRGLFDEKHLRHIFGNLLSNALKYSPPDSTVRFDIECGDEHYVLSVADRGIGIPQADLPKLFETFHRASNVGNIAGTGLGLSIVKRSIDAHGGTIHVESAPGEGTLFRVTLPRLTRPV